MDYQRRWRLDESIWLVICRLVVRDYVKRPACPQDCFMVWRKDAAIVCTSFHIAQNVPERSCVFLKCSCVFATRARRLWSERPHWVNSWRRTNQSLVRLPLEHAFNGYRGVLKAADCVTNYTILLGNVIRPFITLTIQTSDDVFNYKGRWLLFNYKY